MQLINLNMKILNKISVFSVTLLLALFSLALFTPAQAAVPPNTEPATKCLPGYELGNAVCCPQNDSPDPLRDGPSSTDPANGGGYRRCVNDQTGEDVVGLVPFAEDFPRICDDGQFVVEGSSFDNYCIEEEEIVDGSVSGKGGMVFVGCDPQLPAFQVMEVKGGIPYPGPIQQNANRVDLPSFCVGDGGTFATQEEFTEGVCICRDDLRTTTDEITGSCSQFCASSGGVLFSNVGSGGGNPGTPGTPGTPGAGPTDACAEDPQCSACRTNGFTYTALGCIDTSREGITLWIIRFSIGLVMLIDVFRFAQASALIRSGDPEKIKEGQEIVTSAIIAFVLILVAIPLLQFIGIGVLNIFPAGFI